MNFGNILALQICLVMKRVDWPLPFICASFWHNFHSLHAISIPVWPVCILFSQSSKTILIRTVKPLKDVIWVLGKNIFMLYSIRRVICFYRVLRKPLGMPFAPQGLYSLRVYLFIYCAWSNSILLVKIETFLRIPNWYL